MAISTVKERLSLKLELDGGIVNGRQRIQAKTLNNVKTDAADENLFNTAVVLAGLQNKDLLKVKRVEETALVEE